MYFEKDMIFFSFRNDATELPLYISFHSSFVREIAKFKFGEKMQKDVEIPQSKETNRLFKDYFLSLSETVNMHRDNYS